MGKNTMDRQQHIVQNLRVEKDDADIIADAKQAALDSLEEPAA